MIGDFFTKPLQGAKFRKFLQLILNEPLDVDLYNKTVPQECVGAPSYADIVRGVTHDPMTSLKRKLVRFGTAVEDHTTLKLKVSESTKKHATRRSASKQRSLLLAN